MSKLDLKLLRQQLSLKCGMKLIKSWRRS